MERRLTGFFLPILIGVLLWMFFFQNKPQQPGATALPAAGGYAQVSADVRDDDKWVHTFGSEPGPGFRVVFDRRAGAVREIRLIDDHVSIDARDKPQHEPADYYPAVQSTPEGVLMMVLQEDGPTRNFKAVRIDEGVDPDNKTHFRWLQEVSGNEVKLTLDCKDGRFLEKVYRYEPGRRDLLLEVRLRSARAEEPDAGQAYPLLLRGLMLPNPRSEHVIGVNPALALAGTVNTTTQEPAHVVGRAFTAQPQLLASRQADTALDWLGATNRFFGAFLMAADPASAALFDQVRVEGLPEPIDATAEHPPFSVPFPQLAFRLPVPKAGETSKVALRLYVGPKSFGSFDSHPDYARLAPVMREDLTAPGCFSICTIPGVTFMATNLLRLLRVLHGLVGNWGVAIILLTVLVKFCTFFLTFRSQKSMRAFGAKMARVKPELDAIQARYKDDPKRLQAEMMQLYREHKMFPPLGGCLPMFLTIPVFIGLFTALRVAYELRHQPFMGWIHDLSVPDQLFEIGWSWLPHFNLLPIVWMVLYSIMMFRMKLPSDPQQRTVQQMMRWMFLFFGVLLYNYASGLMLYMCASIALAFFEQWLIKKILGPMPEVPGVAAMPTI